jgi:hypothetical protein
VDSLEGKGLALMTQTRALCRRCGQAFDIADMTVYDTTNVAWYLCAICGEDLDGGYQER